MALGTLAAAGPRKSGPLALEWREDFPAPPVPPSTPPDFQAAPVPDIRQSAPAQSSATGPQLRPDLFNPKGYNNGQGYLPGSTIEGQQSQRQRPVPGLNLRIPVR